jgi:hypothetical protein
MQEEIWSGVRQMQLGGYRQLEEVLAQEACGEEQDFQVLNLARIRIQPGNDLVAKLL